jgi:hypothetical protein
LPRCFSTRPLDGQGRDQASHRGGANASDAADIGTFEYQDEIFGDSFGG